MDASAFKRVVFDLARQIGASLIAIYEPNVTPNFITAAIDLGERTVYLLRSDAGDWALCSAVEFSACRLVFDEESTIAEVLRNQYGIQLHSRSALLSPYVRQEGIRDRDVEYWRPETMGEALFNWWD